MLVNEEFAREEESYFLRTGVIERTSLVRLNLDAELCLFTLFRRFEEECLFRGGRDFLGLSKNDKLFLDSFALSFFSSNVLFSDANSLALATFSLRSSFRSFSLMSFRISS